MNDINQIRIKFEELSKTLLNSDYNSFEMHLNDWLSFCEKEEMGAVINSLYDMKILNKYELSLVVAKRLNLPSEEFERNSFIYTYLRNKKPDEIISVAMRCFARGDMDHMIYWFNKNVTNKLINVLNSRLSEMERLNSDDGIARKKPDTQSINVNLNGNQIVFSQGDIGSVSQQKKENGKFKGRKRWYQHWVLQAIIWPILVGFILIVLTPFFGQKETTIASNTVYNESIIMKQINAPLSIEIQSHLPENLDDLKGYLRDYRKNKGLRELLPLEADKPISQTPSGTFFFLDDFDLDLYIPKDKNYSSVLFDKHVNIERKWEENHFFELEYTKENKLFLVGYLSQSDAAKIARLDGLNEMDIQLVSYPIVSQDFKILVSLPIDRISSVNNRRIPTTDSFEKFSILDIKIK